jgi:hypothetical protein
MFQDRFNWRTHAKSGQSLVVCNAGISWLGDGYQLLKIFAKWVYSLMLKTNNKDYEMYAPSKPRADPSIFIVYTKRCDGFRRSVRQGSRIMTFYWIKLKSIALKHSEDLRLRNFVTYLLLQLNNHDSATAIRSLYNTFFSFFFKRKQTHNLHGGG